MTGSDHHTKKTMAGAQALLEEGLPGHQIEGVGHINLKQSKVAIQPVALGFYTLSDLMNNLILSPKASYTILKGLKEISCLVA